MAKARRGVGHAVSPRVVGLILAASILMLSGLEFVTAVTITDKVNHTEVFATLSDRPPERGGTNILLVGSDNREGLSRAKKNELSVGTGDYGRHTDTIMIAHIADDGSVGFVSIPRDSYVEIPAYTTPQGRTVPASHQKINAAYDIGGPSLVVRTVEGATGVRLDHYAEINFLGFVNMVDAVGGVPITTDRPLKDEKSGLDLPEGTTNVDGTQALAYVRARQLDVTADLGRMKRQQGFLGMLFAKATSPAVLANPIKLLSFADAAARAFTVDERMDRTDIWNLMASARVNSVKDLAFETVPITGDTMKAGVGSVIEWDQARSAKLFALLNSGEPVGGRAREPVPVVEVSPTDIRVQVYNGSGISGLGTRAAREFEAAGFDVAGPAQNAKTQGATDTVIQYDPGYDVSLKTLEAALPGARTEEVPNLGRAFKVVVGSSWSGVTPVQLDR